MLDRMSSTDMVREGGRGKEEKGEEGGGRRLGGQEDERKGQGGLRRTVMEDGGEDGGRKGRRDGWRGGWKEGREPSSKISQWTLKDIQKLLIWFGPRPKIVNEIQGQRREEEGNRKQEAGSSRKKEEGRRKQEGRRKKMRREEGRRKKEEGGAVGRTVSGTGGSTIKKKSGADFRNSQNLFPQEQVGGGKGASRREQSPPLRPIQTFFQNPGFFPRAHGNPKFRDFRNQGLLWCA
jgi:hypothetical protein